VTRSQAVIRNGIPVALIALAAIGLAGVAMTTAAAQDPAPREDAGLRERTFTIHYRDLSDIIALIQPIIGPRGSYSVQPRSRAVTVLDAPEIVEKIEDLIAGYDLPPRGIDLVVQLMRAEEGSTDPAAAERRPRGIGLPPAVIQDLTKWGVITPIGSAALSTSENESGTVSMGDDFRLRFSVGTVSASVGLVRMERFVVERVKASAPGAASGRAWAPLMDLVLNLKDRQTTVLGATSSQDSRQALFVSVTATIVE